MGGVVNYFFFFPLLHDTTDWLRTRFRKDSTSFYSLLLFFSSRLKFRLKFYARQVLYYTVKDEYFSFFLLFIKKNVSFRFINFPFLFLRPSESLEELDQFQEFDYPSLKFYIRFNKLYILLLQLLLFKSLLEKVEFNLIFHFSLSLFYFSGIIYLSLTLLKLTSS